MLRMKNGGKLVTLGVGTVLVFRDGVEHNFSIDVPGEDDIPQPLLWPGRNDDKYVAPFCIKTSSDIKAVARLIAATHGYHIEQVHDLGYEHAYRFVDPS